MKIHQDYDAVIVGSGMGGMTAASMLARDGLKVKILEASHVPGGCSSSYKRKGFVFESGATTLIGFDENQPLRKLEEETGISIPRREISPGMTVWIDGEPLTRYKDRTRWKKEAGRVFGNEREQEKFWDLALRISDTVWKVSLNNPFFPPQKITDLVDLLKNNSPLDVWILKYAFESTASVCRRMGVATDKFMRFVDEQLMITAQSVAEDTPFLFGAAGLTYTNYSNYYVPGGLLNMVETLQEYVEQRGGSLQNRYRVEMIKERGQAFRIYTSTDEIFEAPVVVSNIPVWNMKDISSGPIREYFESEAAGYEWAWGAITMGIAIRDAFPDNMTLHHQIHLPTGTNVPYTNSDSVFISLSEKGDINRAPDGMRTLNISTHADPERWFGLNGNYVPAKQEVENFIVRELERQLPGFLEKNIKTIHTSTPVTWQNWVYRKKGRVGGIPQSMARSLLRWTPNETPFKGLYLCGDTTYPGQGIPGVTLSGLNVYYRIKKYIKDTFG